MDRFGIIFGGRAKCTRLILSGGEGEAGITQTAPRFFA